MVWQKRLDYGFNGYQAPHVPRAARSARRRGPPRKYVGDTQMYAFDLLATIAGKILLEGQDPTSSLSTGKLSEKNVGGPLKVEQLDSVRSPDADDEENPEISVNLYDIKSGAQENSPEDILSLSGGTLSGHASDITSSGCADKIIHDKKTALSSYRSDSVSRLRNVDRRSLGPVGSCVPKLENHAEEQIESMQVDSVVEAPICVGANSCSSDGPEVFNHKASSVLVSSDRTIKPNILKSYYRYSSVFSSRDDCVGVDSKDDDEKSSQCTHRSAFIRRGRFSARAVDRKIRKFLGSRHWRMPPRMKDEDLSDNGGRFHSTYQYRKYGYSRQRSHRIYPLKKRKLFHYKSPSHSSDTSGYDGIHTSSEEATIDMSTSAFGNDMLPSTSDSQVKLKIKSFRVPELFIEMPETATIGSLKRTVMEAISAFLGGELGVGVLVEGRKIRDDNKTLLQTGISHDNQPDAMGFTLEPISSQEYSPMCLDDLHFRDIAPPITSDIGDQSAQATSAMAHQANPFPSPDYQPNRIANAVESDHDSATLPAEIPSEKATADSGRALVAVPELKAEALVVVPPQQKYKRSEIAQRRIRRPFSVTEVEALVHAVEQLGTGRWRDVKLRAFDNIKHRTYVDLKDKWKTLVHTAKISPQQRRGEPVPQELLDRVLAAHAYWSQHQAKQQLKQEAHEGY